MNLQKTYVFIMVLLSGVLGLVTSIMVLKFIDRNQDDSIHAQKSKLLLDNNNNNNNF